jgi:hypothetical protein
MKKITARWLIGFATLALSSAAAAALEAAKDPPPDPTGLHLGNMIANKILFLGNSITLTRHDTPSGPWPHDCGVAASAPSLGGDIAGTCGRDARCVCGCCWVRRAVSDASTRSTPNEHQGKSK